MRERHNVYVIELDKDVLYEAKFKKGQSRLRDWQALCLRRHDWS
jgi:hypothetical protein